LEILADAQVPTSKRIECAEALLGYEAPNEAHDEARNYLVEVFEDREQDLNLRMEALRISRKFESPKTSQGIVRLQDTVEYTEQERRRAILRRKIILAKMGIMSWDFPKGWDADLRSPDWVPPPPGTVFESTTVIAERLKKESKIA
jgi:hypothetical protein